MGTKTTYTVTGRGRSQDLEKCVKSHYVSEFVLCFMKYGSWKGFKRQKWLSRSFKSIGNGAIRYPTSISDHRWGWPCWNFASPWAIVWRCLRDPMFKHLCRTPTCDRQTDKQTDGHMMTAYITLPLHRGVNIKIKGQFIQKTVETHWQIDGQDVSYYDTSPANAVVKRTFIIQ